MSRPLSPFETFCMPQEMIRIFYFDKKKYEVTKFLKSKLFLERTTSEIILMNHFNLNKKDNDDFLLNSAGVIKGQKKRIKFDKNKQVFSFCDQTGFVTIEYHPM
jgi:hypothetical protein